MSISTSTAGRSAGIGRLFDDQEYWTIEDNAIEFRNKAYAKQAAVFYALIEAVGATGAVAWQAHPDGVVAGTSRILAGRDMATANAAALQILHAVAGKGYGVTAQNADFIVLVPEQLRGRAMQALIWQQQAFIGSPTRANYRFTVISTTMLADTAHAWMHPAQAQTRGRDCGWTSPRSPRSTCCPTRTRRRGGCGTAGPSATRTRWFGWHGNHRLGEA